MTLIKKPFLSPNTDSQSIDVQFLILHYTSADLQQTFNIFKNPSKKTSCHIIIDLDGSIYEILPCLDESPVKAFHAGRSFWIDSQKKKHSDLNKISLGVELINLNGNIFTFTEPQYCALASLIKKLKTIYPTLKNPHHILGHEHIAGFRGKVDPGHQFHWKIFFTKAYPEINFSTELYPSRSAVLPIYLKERFQDLIHHLPDNNKNWMQLNALLEQQYRHHLETNSP